MSYLRVHDEHKVTDQVYFLSNWRLMSANGTIEILVCDSCGYITATCIHERNTWNDEGTILSCNMCGADVT
jgi:hypothetical protein